MIVSSVAVSFGFGKYLELLTESQIDNASKVGRGNRHLKLRLTKIPGNICSAVAIHCHKCAY